MAAKLTDENLEQIAEYLAKKYPAIRGGGRTRQQYREIEIEIRERIVRVEEELKNQRELIYRMIEMFDKRFEEMRGDTNARFEESRASANSQFALMQSSMDSRFETMQSFMNTRFETMHDTMNTRFEAVQNFMNTRFEAVQNFMNARFEQVDRKFSMIMWFMGVGFTFSTTIVTVIVTLFR